MLPYLETTNSSVQAVIISFLNFISNSQWEVIQGQDNRVPEPIGSSFIVVTPTLKERLSTNVDVFADVAFNAAVSGLILVVSSVRFGTINTIIQPVLWGIGVVPCNILSQISGTLGGTGNYFLSGSAQNIAQGKMAAGVEKILTPWQVTYQIDFHSADGSSSDMAAMFTSAWRDEVAVDFFSQSGIRATPLYCETPRQTPFINAEQQFEWRWTVDAHLQVNAITDWPMQFADNVIVTIYDVT